MLEQIGYFVLIVSILIGLAAINRYRGYLRRGSRETLPNLLAGLAVLTVVCLLKLAQSDSAAASVGFLSEPIFLDLAFSIGAITGSILIANAVSAWLTGRRLGAARRAKAFRAAVETIHRLAGVESRPGVLLKEAMVHLVDSVDTGAGVVFGFSHGRSRVVTMAQHAHGQHGLRIDSRFHAAVAALLSWRPSDPDDRPQLEGLGMTQESALAIPAIASGRLVALIVISCPDEFPESAPTAVRHLVTCLSDAVAASLDRTRSRMLALQADAMAIYQQQSTRARSVRELLVPCAEAARKIVTISRLSMIVSDEDRGPSRFTIGRGRQILVERNLPLRTVESLNLLSLAGVDRETGERIYTFSGVEGGSPRVCMVLAATRLRPWQRRLLERIRLLSEAEVARIRRAARTALPRLPDRTLLRQSVPGDPLPGRSRILPESAVSEPVGQ